MKLLLVGYGNISRNLIDILLKRKELIKHAYGESIEIEAIIDSKGVYSGFQSMYEMISTKQEGSHVKYRVEGLDPINAIKTLDYDLLVELTSSTLDGEPGISYVKSAFHRGKDVVTANKSILVNDFGLIDYANTNGLLFKFEATVCGSLPVFTTLDNYYSKATIKRISGAFNATSSFVIKKMEDGIPFKDAINLAIREGMAEKEYKEDIFGVDSARKSLILHNYVFGNNMRMKDVQIDIKDEDITAGKRLISEIEESMVRVRYINKLEKDKIFDFNEAGMSISIESDLFDNQTFIVEHDGPKESAAAVYSDILDIMKVRHHE